VAHQFVGVDAHKRSVTVAVVDAVGGELAAASFANSSHGVEEVAVWLHAAAPAVLRIGVEGSSGHGRHLAQRLVAAGYDVREVPPRRTAERRRARRAPKDRPPRQLRDRPCGRRGAEAGPGQTRCRAWRGPR
jgi:transposase